MIHPSFNLRRSRYLIWATVGAHGVALVAVGLWAGPSLPAALLALAVCLSLVLVLRRPWPVRLRLGRDAVWELTRSDGRLFRAEIADGRVLARVISITFRNRRAGSIVLLPDALCDADRIRLRGVLRHRCGGAS